MSGGKNRQTLDRHDCDTTTLSWVMRSMTCFCVGSVVEGRRTPHQLLLQLASIAQHASTYLIHTSCTSHLS